MNPRTDRTGTLGLRVPTRDFVSIATGPDDAWIGGIGERETGFAATHAAFPTGVHDAAVFEGRSNARAAHVRTILHVGVDEIRNLIVYSDVVHLADRELNAMEAAAVNRGDIEATIVGDYEAVGILRINPNVVIVPTPGNFFEKFAAIERFEKAAVGDVNFVVVASGNGNADVITRAADELALVIDGLPAFSGVVGAPERALISCLDEREVAIRIGWRDSNIDFAERRFRQAAAFELGPFRAAIFGNVNCAAGTAAQFAVRVHFHLPHSGEKNARVVRVHSQTGTTGVAVGEEHALPMLAAVGGAIDAALLLRAGGAAEHANKSDVGIRGIYQDAPDTSGFVEAGVRPVFAVVR